MYRKASPCTVSKKMKNVPNKAEEQKRCYLLYFKK